jgi:hypothetical protein
MDFIGAVPASPFCQMRQRSAEEFKGHGDFDTANRTA